MAIIAMLVAIGMIWFGQASDKQKVAALDVEVHDIVAAVHSLYGTSATYASLSITYLVSNAGLKPADVNGTTLISPFNSPVYVAPNTFISANDSITVTVTGLSRSQCIAFVLTDMGGYFQAIGIGSVYVTGRQLTVAEAETGCALAKGNSIGLVFY
jgi:type II secretory pathway pseudopilin PulG